MRVDAALVPIGTVSGEPEFARGPADAGGLEVGHLEQEVGGGVVDLGIGAAHDAGDDQRPGGVRDDEHAAAEPSLPAVKRDEFLAGARGAHDDAASADLPGVKRMDRLAGLEHDEVAGVDDIVDRAQADRLEALLQPGRARADLHAGDDVRGVKRAVLAGLDGHLGEEVAPPGRAHGQSGELHRRVNQIAAEPRGQFARHAEMAEGVRPVGCDLDVEHDVTGRQHLVDGGPERGPPVQDQQAGVLAAKAKLVWRTHHAVRKLAADLRLLDFEITGQDGAGQRHEHAVADLVVRRAADNRLHAPVGAHVDGANRELVGIGMRQAGEHLADHDVLERGHPRADHLLNLETEKRDGMGDFLGGGVERHVLLKPA